MQIKNIRYTSLRNLFEFFDNKAYIKSLEADKAQKLFHKQQTKMDTLKKYYRKKNCIHK